MGLAASQIRFMSLTARLSDLEFQGQQISGERQRLSVQSEQIAQKYTDALNGTNTNLSSGSKAQITLSASSLMSLGLNGDIAQRLLIATDSGKVLVSNELKDAYDKAGGDYSSFLKNLSQSGNSYYQNLFNEIKTCKGCVAEGPENYSSANWLSQNLNQGNYYMKEMISGSFQDVDWASQENSITQTSDKDSLAKAEAEYDTAIADINSKDKILELNSKNIDTEHQAIQTEYDSVKKVIDKNIERSFKVFNG
jgi:hypothetical protein